MSTNLCSHTVEERASIVAALVRHSVTSWLEVAKHVRAAKLELTESDFTIFIQITGLTRAICDKLLRIAQCQRLYEREFQKHCNRLDGWTNLYELSKLKNAAIDNFVQHIEHDTNVAVTNEFIRSFASSKSSGSKAPASFVVAKVLLLHDELNRLDLVEFDKIKELLGDIQRKIDAAAPAIVIKVFDVKLADVEARLSFDTSNEQDDPGTDVGSAFILPSNPESHSQNINF